MADWAQQVGGGGSAGRVADDPMYSGIAPTKLAAHLFINIISMVEVNELP